MRADKINPQQALPVAQYMAVGIDETGDKSAAGAVDHAVYLGLVGELIVRAVKRGDTVVFNLQRAELKEFTVTV